MSRPLSMAELGARFGITSPPVPTPAPAFAPTAQEPASTDEPCSDAVAASCSALIAGLGSDDAVIRVLRTELSAPYGKDRRAAAVASAIERRLAAMPRGKANEIRAAARDAWTPPTRNASTQQEWMDEIVAALSSGAYDAHRRADKQAATVDRWPDPPDVAAVAPLDWAGQQAAIHAYSAALSTWADERTERELRVLAYPGDHSLTEAFARSVREAAAAYAAAAKSRTADEFIARMRAGEDFDKLASEASYDTEAALRATPEAWASGRARQGAPPQGWEAISDDVVRLYTGRTSESVRDGALAEAARRWQDGHVLHVTEYDATYILRGAVAVQLKRGDSALPSVGATVAFAPCSAGWAEPIADDRDCQWCDSRVYAALTRVLSRERAVGLDVRRIIDAYDRHPEKRFPRCSWKVWGNWLTVGIDDTLGAVLDDLAIVARNCPDRVPAGCWRIAAEVRRTAAGGLQITPTRAPEAAVMVAIAGGTSSHGRHGHSGEIRLPRQGSPALAAQATGHSNGGGQHRSIVVAVLREGHPLLLETGVGYRLGGSTGVERVAGLAEGRLGEATPF